MKNVFLYSIALTFGLLMSCGGKSGTKIETTDLDSLVKMYPDSMPILIKHGQKMIKEMDFSKAIADAAKAYHKDSNNIEARMLYADVLNNRPTRTFTDVLNAQRHFKVIIKKEPKNTKALVGLATTYSQQQDFEKAFQYINTALKVNPRYRDAYVLKGTIYLQLGNPKLAKSSYETAVQQDPKFFEAYLMLGSLYETDNDPICLEYYTTAAKIEPNNPDVLYSLAYASQKFDKVNQAKRLYKKMIQLDSTYHEALFQLGYIKQYIENQRDSAEYYYRSAIETNPQFVEAYHNLGLCLEADGEKSLALKSFAKALKYNPNFELSRTEATRINKNFDPYKER
jgi:tetratricopeptide (TPR) repeat protein